MSERYAYDAAPGLPADAVPRVLWSMMLEVRWALEGTRAPAAALEPVLRRPRAGRAGGDLRSLGDRLLQDIGYHRSQLPWMARAAGIGH